MNLPDLIEKSKTNKAAEIILNIAVKKAFGDRKPLTEILDKIAKKTHDNFSKRNSISDS